MQLQDTEVVGIRPALENRDLDAAEIPAEERALLEFVRTVTLHAHQTTDEDTERLRQLGWTDPQIAEAVYITAMFAFFNRVADAFGLDNPQYDDVLKGLPPASIRAAEDEE